MRPELDAAGVALFAISYDSVAILRAFAGARGITFPLLSDDGSATMRRLGLINKRVLDDHAAYGIPPNPRHANLPYPGAYVLDERGVVVRKRFHESYRERDSGASLLALALGRTIAPPTSAPGGGSEAVQVRAWLGSDTYAWFQRILLEVEITIGPGFHLYAASAPEGLTALSVAISPVEGVEVGPVELPGPIRLADAAPGEAVDGYEGTLRLSVPLTFNAQPGAGRHVVVVTVGYQACSTSLCLPPAAARFELPIDEVALVDRSLPSRTP